MTKTLEIRVRPVTRHVVTRYESDGLRRGGASCGTLGEFDSPARADEVALAIQAQEPHARVVISDGTVHDPIEQQFVITKVNTFEVQNEVYFANSFGEALSLLNKLETANTAEKWSNWQIFDRAKNLPYSRSSVSPDSSAGTKVGAEPLSQYDAAMAHGPAAYVGYAPILVALARGERVEWFNGEEWVYQHPSHTLNEIKGVLCDPGRYRVAQPDLVAAT